MMSKSGLVVWYDDFVLELGDSLRREIDRGLARCRFGVVVMSRDFFRKEWPQRELDGLVARETNEGRKVILPIWHNISLNDVTRYSPALADRVAIRTSEGLDVVSERIVSAVRGSGVQSLMEITGTWEGKYGLVRIRQDNFRIFGEFEFPDHGWVGKLNGEICADRVVYEWLWEHHNIEGIGYWLLSENRLKGWWWNADECPVKFDELRKDPYALDAYPVSTYNEWTLHRHSDGQSSNEDRTQSA